MHTQTVTFIIKPTYPYLCNYRATIFFLHLAFNSKSNARRSVRLSLHCLETLSSSSIRSNLTEIMCIHYLPVYSCFIALDGYPFFLILLFIITVVFFILSTTITSIINDVDNRCKMRNQKKIMLSQLVTRYTYVHYQSM